MVDDRYGRRGERWSGPDYDRGYGPARFRDDDDFGYRGERYGGEAYRREYGSGYARDVNERPGGGYGRENFGRGYGRGQDYDRDGYDRDYSYRRYEKPDWDDRFGPGGYGAGRYGYGGGDRPYGYGGAFGPERYGRGRYEGGRHPDDRGFLDRAGDEVASWFGSEEAERRRRRDARYGDESAQHHRGKGPRGYTRSDSRIDEDVSDRLTDDPFLDASEIEVSVSSCEVTLNGTVASRNDKRRAEDLADDVSGVKHVQNNLRVSEPNADTGNEFPRSTTTGPIKTGIAT